MRAIAATERHDRAAHRHAAESDNESETDQHNREAALRVGKQQIADAVRIEQQNSRQQQQRDRDAGDEIDRQQPEQRMREESAAATIRILSFFRHRPVRLPPAHQIDTATSLRWPLPATLIWIKVATCHSVTFATIRQ